jgi:hypothetical protein
LTAKEFGLLEYLMLNTGRRVTRAMIIEHVWKLSFDTCTNVVDLYVNYKNVRVLFGDLFYADLGTTGSGDPIELGAGTRIGGMPGMFTQGSAESTGVPTDSHHSGRKVLCCPKRWRHKLYARRKFRY